MRGVTIFPSAALHVVLNEKELPHLTIEAYRTFSRTRFFISRTDPLRQHRGLHQPPCPATTLKTRPPGGRTSHT